jgi:hypothetical protein
LSCLHNKYCHVFITKYPKLGSLLPELDICWHSLIEFYISPLKSNWHLWKYYIETKEQTWHCEQMHILIFVLSTSKKGCTNSHSSFQLVVFRSFLQKFKIFSENLIIRELQFIAMTAACTFPANSTEQSSLTSSLSLS